MKYLIIILLFTCAFAAANAQVNFVKNPDFEKFSFCPFNYNQLTYCEHWNNAIDTVGTPIYASEYFNACATTNPKVGITTNDNFYQTPHSGSGMVGAALFYDEASSPNYREYIQGHLLKTLEFGKAYCISFYVNMMEISGYAHDKIGVYLDDGAINKLSIPPSSPINTLIPQVTSTIVVSDTLAWVKIEGSFIANGIESYITIGNYSNKSSISYFLTDYMGMGNHYSYYLIDDVSVIPIDLPADAGKDTWVELGKQVQIGRVGDTTAIGLDCKWYHKGLLIDSGAIISVNASSIKNAIDTYVVVQTICGTVKSDTVLVKTTGLGIKANSAANTFSIYPNPSSGTLVIASAAKQSEAKIYDLLGRIIHQQNLSFSNQAATIKLNIPNGSYILELRDEDGNVQRERIVIE